MKLKKIKEENELENLIIQTKKKEKKKKNSVDVVWVIQIAIMSFCISLFMSLFSELMLSNVTLLLSIIITLLFILVGILFDIIGVSVTSSDEKVFHSMNSRKVHGANVAVKFKKNADKVSSFCCDVIGDICGVISGSSGIVIATTLIEITSVPSIIVTLLTTALIASITITGKALGKSLAINKGNIILYEFAKIISVFYKK